MAGDKRYTGDRDLENPLAAVQMGLIYVNPEGPNGNPDPLAAARDIRETFARMAMNDEETVALIAGGHTFGKTHGAADASKYVGPEPEGARIEEQGPRLEEQLRQRQRRRHDRQRPGRHLDHDADEVGQQLLRQPVRLRMGTDEEPGRCASVDAEGWTPAPAPCRMRTTRRSVTRRSMLTTDLALRLDPVYEKISRRFHENPDEFADAFARAWFKLTHRDMGPRARYLGPEVPAEELLWQDPVPAVDHALIDAQDIARAQGQDPRVGPVDLRNWSRRPGPRRRPSAAPTSAAGRTARASASRRRRIGRSTSPPNWRRCSTRSRGSRRTFNGAQSGGKKVSLADLIVLGGCAAVEQAAKNAGHDVEVPFTPGRTDASQEQTDVESFAVLEPTADGFRNYLKAGVQRFGGGDAGRQARNS